uniref:Uncharacterized protein n=1 Tax=Myoviridae sp. ctIty1 TaxID=2827673 RepID=A0A8S5THA0_9CAUD|nr:MAG TPA: hypothetical protein [Myoviridae sp. ctIty1]
MVALGVIFRTCVYVNKYIYIRLGGCAQEKKGTFKNETILATKKENKVHIKTKRQFKNLNNFNNSNIVIALNNGLPTDTLAV